MLTKLRHRLNYGVTLAAVAALLAAGVPNLVIHAHADGDDSHGALIEQAHHGDHPAGGNTAPQDNLHLHDFGVLGQSPVLPSAMPGVTLSVGHFTGAEPSNIAATAFSSHPFRPPVA